MCSAIRRRTPRSGSRRPSPAGAAARTSSSVIRLCGPVPLTEARSTPSSLAILRTSGVARTLASSAAAASCCGAGSARGFSSATAGVAPSSPMTTRTVPTGTIWPSSTRICATLPAAGDGISTVVLSVCTSTSGSSSAISWPTETSQRAISPSVRPSPRSGSLNSYAMPRGNLAATTILLHLDELDVAPAREAAHMPAGLVEAGALVHLDCTLVERGDLEDDRTAREAGPREIESGLQELGAEPEAGQVGAKAEPDLDCLALLLEVVEADERPVITDGAVEALRVQDRVLVAVVEGVRRIVAPGPQLGERLSRRRRDRHLHQWGRPTQASAGAIRTPTPPSTPQIDTACSSPLSSGATSRGTYPACTVRSSFQIPTALGSCSLSGSATSVSRRPGSNPGLSSASGRNETPAT